MNEKVNQPYSLKNPPPASSEIVKKVMKSIKSKDTKAEIALRKALRDIGMPGYRLHWAKVKGKPDISYPGKKIAIFVNGCFWHGCPLCKKSLPKTHATFWREKIEKNKMRDENNMRILKQEGWDVFVFWECEIKKNVDRCAKKVKEAVDKRQK